MDQPEIETVRQQSEQTQPVCKTFRKMNMELSALNSAHNFLCCRGCRDQSGHGKVVPGGEWRGDKTGIDEIYTDTTRTQIEIERFAQIDQCGFGRPVDQGLR